MSYNENPAYEPLITISTNQIAYGTGINTVGGLTLPSIPGVPLNYSGSATGYFNPSQMTYQFDDFIGPGAANLIGTNTWASATSGTASTILPNVITDSGHPGQMQLYAGTSGTGYAIIRQGPNAGTGWPFILGGGPLTCIWVIQIPVDSTGTNTFVVRCGLMNANVGQAVGSGVYFEHTNATGSPTDWSICTANANSRTVTDSSIVMTAGTWYTLRLDVNATASSVAYSINGSVVASGPITSNIPTPSIGPCCFILQSAGSVGGIVDIDMFYLFQSLTNTR